MRSTQLLHQLKFNESNPNAEPLFVDESGRIIRFTLKPGQEIREHNAPHSPFYAIILAGRGLFAGEDGVEQEFGPTSMLIFEPGEMHSVRALDEELVFVGILHGAPGARPGRIGGELGRESA